MIFVFYNIKINFKYQCISEGFDKFVVSNDVIFYQKFEEMKTYPNALTHCMSLGGLVAYPRVRKEEKIIRVKLTEKIS